MDEIQAQLNIVLGIRRSSSLVSYAGSINTKKVYRNLCKGLFESGVTAEMIKSKEKEIYNVFNPPNATTSNQIDASTNAGQSQSPEGGNSSGSETLAPLPTISTESNQNRLRFPRVLPPVDFLVGPLMLDAAKAGNIKRLKSTLGYVRDINFMDDTGATALHHAASGGYDDIVQLLLSKGASIEAGTKYNDTPLHLAAYNDRTSTMGLLLSKGALIGATNEDNNTPLHGAAQHGHTSIVELLLSKGASIEVTNKYNNTPLHLATLFGYTSIVELLLSKGAPTEVTNKYNNTPLHHAARFGHTSTVKLLLSKGASIEATNKDNYTPLHRAAQSGHTSIRVVELLLSKGASIEATDKDNNTPLHCAAQSGHISTVELLLSKGASIEVTNISNSTPLQLARRRPYNNSEVVRLLEMAEATKFLETYKTASR